MSDIDERTRRAAEHWGLAVGPALVGGTRSAVFAAHDETGRDLVLKLPATRTDAPDSTAAEAAALETWARTGAAITLVGATADALLLVRARPGVLRPWSSRLPLDETISIAAELLGRLWAAPSGAYHFPTLAEVFPENERVAREDAAFEQRERRQPDRGRPGVLRLRAAGASAEHLIASTGQMRLLHGDFITRTSSATPTARWVGSPSTRSP